MGVHVADGDFRASRDETQFPPAIAVERRFQRLWEPCGATVELF
jgi:hypothetical protein